MDELGSTIFVPRDVDPRHAKALHRAMRDAMPAIAAALPDWHSPVRFVATARVYIENHAPALYQEDPDAVAAAILDAARDGVPIDGHAATIVRGEDGALHLRMPPHSAALAVGRATDGVSPHVEIVTEDDRYRVIDAGGFPQILFESRHLISKRTPGPFVCAYATMAVHNRRVATIIPAEDAERRHAERAAPWPETVKDVASAMAYAALGEIALRGVPQGWPPVTRMRRVLARTSGDPRAIPPLAGGEVVAEATRARAALAEASAHLARLARAPKWLRDHLAEIGAILDIRQEQP